MTDDQFPISHKLNNAKGQPHYPKNHSSHAGQSRVTQHGHAPINPPPAKVPEQRAKLLTVEPGALRGCLYRDTYISLVNRTSFWFHPTYIDYSTTSGFKWNGYAWIPWGTDLDRIKSFQCT